ncbi:MAG: sigma-70 family RNA polymerase sigma factor [Opitutus sp.]|nr:sigma-70 family RNA polymerase sigma factor [Opitutus sp.]
MALASLRFGGNGFGAILAHPALSPPPPQRLPTAEENRWFSDEVYVHEPSLRAYLRTQYPFAPDLDDVVQESFLRLWKVRMGQPVRYAKALLFKVARHLVIDTARRNQISPIDHVTDLAALSVIDDGRPGPAEVACKREEVVLLAAAIDSLPARCREILILRKLRGVPQKAIAAQLGLSEQTVQVQVSRGVRRCEDFLRAHGVQP